MGEDGAQVVRLFPRADADANPVKTKPRDYRNLCRHERVELDDEVRRVYCQDCGSEVEAFAYLKFLSYEFDKWTRMRDEAERQAKVARENLEELKREERNAKARLRRARSAS